MEMIYQEPALVKAGEEICLAHKNDASAKADITAILSNALITVRLLGPAGLAQWIDRKSKERGCLLAGLEKAGIDAGKLREKNIETAWSCSERIIAMLCYAKWYAKAKG